MSREGISPIAIAIILVALAVVSGGIAYWWLGKAPSNSEQEGLAAAGDTAPEDEARPAAPVEATEPPPRRAVPPLDASDSVMRDWVRGLSQHPELARWLASEDLVRRFVAAVDSVARGDSPHSQLEMMRPSEGFQAAEIDGRLRIDPATYRRYDLAADVFVSLDIGASVRLFHELEPLFEEAHSEISEPGRTFRQTLADALDRILAAELPAGEPELERHLLVYRFADPELEAVSPAVKHLLRMGPENAEKVQKRLRFLRSALDLDAAPAAE